MHVEFHCWVLGVAMIRTLLNSLFLSIGLATIAAPGQQAPNGAWSFAVSGDSRNCGEVVMPAIAAGALRHDVTRYWHLADLRAMYGVDEDMQVLNGKSLSLDEYRRIAWGDFLANQVAPFGSLPVFVGIGNHKLYMDQDKSKSQPENDAQNRADFRAQFGYWLRWPEIVRSPVPSKTDSPETYYHWSERQVDWIYLDNAANDGFDEAQLSWLEAHWKNRNELMEGWIVGTAGAARYALPQGLPPSILARTYIYGYLLGTVQPDGKIMFQFQQLAESDVPRAVQDRYGADFVHQWFHRQS
jgi:hypothetical protein